MTEINTILTQLEAASHAGTLKRYEKIGETKPYYGVPMGAISGIAKAYKNRLDLFAPLWQIGILEAQYLAIQIAKTKPDQLTSTALETCLNEQVSVNVLDKLASIILSKRKDSKDWEAYLLDKNSAIFQRIGWFLRAKYFAGKIATNQEIEETLTYINEHLQTADPLVQWTMNQCLVEIAVAYPDYLKQGLAIGQELAVYADMKVPKGCTSAYAPDWIEALLRKK
ncbi:DNA alkylation repair protein [Streptococcus suis]|uniref:DNA alkylation repair protein n=1 Tax=Streptococcus suis TaxID=1307 RepID=UPI0004291525|nr:DNA alkylation repair protein [Streptococcus suis]NQH21456.1 DNA alkylation repair protein [Streptococcus suis]CYU64085.1 DNA alkylation repair enzyme [Streptococcus suis]HEL1600228.1 DNA alkylation repair protein [Streptococcus suis]HEM2798600.1 DNA alkylation repair protein [Streptococcus suis]HEM3208500.1 DNA alkylation repair protein [Streptococcus suis 22083]